MENTELALVEQAKAMLPEDFSKKYKQLQKLKAELDEVEKQVKAQLIELFQNTETEDKSINIDGLQFTYVKEFTRSTIDSKKLQEEMPEIYEKFLKTSVVKPTIKTSVKY